MRMRQRRFGKGRWRQEVEKLSFRGRQFITKETELFSHQLEFDKSADNVFVLGTADQMIFDGVTVDLGCTFSLDPVNESLTLRPTPLVFLSDRERNVSDINKLYNMMSWDRLVDRYVFRSDGTVTDGEPLQELGAGGVESGKGGRSLLNSKQISQPRLCRLVTPGEAALDYTTRPSPQKPDRLAVMTMVHRLLEIFDTEPERTSESELVPDGGAVKYGAQGRKQRTWRSLLNMACYCTRHKLPFYLFTGDLRSGSYRSRLTKKGVYEPANPFCNLADTRPPAQKVDAWKPSLSKPLWPRSTWRGFGAEDAEQPNPVLRNEHAKIVGMYAILKFLHAQRVFFMDRLSYFSRRSLRSPSNDLEKVLSTALEDDLVVGMPQTPKLLDPTIMMLRGTPWSFGFLKAWWRNRCGGGRDDVSVLQTMLYGEWFALDGVMPKQPPLFFLPHYAEWPQMMSTTLLLQTPWKKRVGEMMCSRTGLASGHEETVPGQRLQMNEYLTSPCAVNHIVRFPHVAILPNVAKEAGEQALRAEVTSLDLAVAIRTRHYEYPEEKPYFSMPKGDRWSYTCDFGEGWGDSAPKGESAEARWNRRKARWRRRREKQGPKWEESKFKGYRVGKESVVDGLLAGAEAVTERIPGALESTYNNWGKVGGALGKFGGAVYDKINGKKSQGTT